MKKAGIDNAWRRAAIGWFVAILLASILAWPTLATLRTVRSTGAWLALLLVFAIPMAYLLPRLVNEHAGPRATLLQIAVLATALAFHVLGHLARGTYPWIYLVWQLERKHGKPVHLAAP